jgi:hypothetical protein
MEFLRDFFALPMSPAQSWALIIVLAFLCWAVTYGMRIFIYFIDLCSWNVKLKGLKGILYALGGYELEEIPLEKVVGVSRKQGAYVVHSSDGEECYEYLVVPVASDEDSKDYREAVEISNGNKELFQRLKPESRLVKKVNFSNRSTGEVSSLYIVYLKYNNSAELTNLFNRLFEEEYEKEIRKFRRNHTLVS